MESEVNTSVDQSSGAFSFLSFFFPWVAHGASALVLVFKSPHNLDAASTVNSRRVYYRPRAYFFVVRCPPSSLLLLLRLLVGIIPRRDPENCGRLREETEKTRWRGMSSAISDNNFDPFWGERRPLECPLTPVLIV